MKKNMYLINILHAVTLGIACLVEIVVRTFWPSTLLPHISIPGMVLLSLIPMVIEYYLVSEIKRDWLISVLLAGATFAFLPVCAGLDVGASILKLFAVGAAVFGVTDILYRSIGEKMSSGSYVKIAPIANAFVLYLASQCLQGLL